MNAKIHIIIFVLLTVLFTIGAWLLFAYSVMVSGGY